MSVLNRVWSEAAVSGRQQLQLGIYLLTETKVAGRYMRVTTAITFIVVASLCACFVIISILSVACACRCCWTYESR